MALLSAPNVLQPFAEPQPAPVKHKTAKDMLMIRFMPLAAGLIAVQAAAAEPAGITAANGFVYARHGSGHYTPALAHKSRLPAIFENFATLYPKGLYNGSMGASINGPDTIQGQIWLAAGFTPAVTATVQEIDVAATFINGTRNAVQVHLYADASGVPGTELWSRNVALPPFGDCCAIAVLDDRSKAQVIAGTPYWIGITTVAPGDFMGAWDTEVLDQVDAGPAAQNRGTGWVAGPSVPPFAFGVYGK